MLKTQFPLDPRYSWHRERLWKSHAGGSGISWKGTGAIFRFSLRCPNLSCLQLILPSIPASSTKQTVAYTKTKLHPEMWAISNSFTQTCTAFVSHECLHRGKTDPFGVCPLWSLCLDPTAHALMPYNGELLKSLCSRAQAPTAPSTFTQRGQRCPCHQLSSWGCCSKEVSKDLSPAARCQHCRVLPSSAGVTHGQLASGRLGFTGNLGRGRNSMS